MKLFYSFFFSIYEDNFYDRVVSMQLPCEENPGLYCDVDMGKNYSVATASFLANGGSKFQRYYTTQIDIGEPSGS